MLPYPGQEVLSTSPEYVQPYSELVIHHASLPNIQQSDEPPSFFSSQPIAEPDKIPNAFRIQWNFATGKLAGSESFDGHPTYNFELFYIDEIFGDVRQPWNRNYDNAVKIFGFNI